MTERRSVKLVNRVQYHGTQTKQVDIGSRITSVKHQLNNDV